VPQERGEEFISLFLKRFEKLYLKSNKNQKLTHIVNQRQYDRLTALLEDAKAQGANLHTVEASPQEERLLYPHLVTDVSPNMRIMQEEIFGPFLPVKPYNAVDEAIDYINQRQRPLALYVMSDDKSTIKHIVRNTHSGGVGVNDTVLHVGAEDAPFGGVGESGIGHYHGE
ncbi:aldehyde dehydrogenase family protein, partial [Vibrio parahaemolyticus]|nr:aldehyde dehydrogenase family protein [Vibrio parahaemolyticus]